MSNSKSLGFSLGTTTSVIASKVDHIVADDMGSRSTSTAVGYSNDEWVIGAAASAASIKAPKKCVWTVAALLAAEKLKAKSADDSSVKFYGEFPFDSMIDGDACPIGPEENPKVKATEVATHFLKHINTLLNAAAGADAKVNVVTVAVPRYADNAALSKLCQDIELTKGLATDIKNTAVRFVPEDVAACVAAEKLYGNPFLFSPAVSPVTPQKKSPGCLRLVLNWGANSVSASVLKVAASGAITSLSHRADVSGKFGGRALDASLAKTVATLFKMKNKGTDPLNDGRAMRKLTAAAEQAKFVLSVSPSTTVNVEALCEGIDCQETLTQIKANMALDNNGGLARLKTLALEALTDAAVVAELESMGFEKGQGEDEDEDEEDEEYEEYEEDEECEAETSWTCRHVGGVVLSGGVFRLGRASAHGRNLASTMCPGATVLAPAATGSAVTPTSPSSPAGEMMGPEELAAAGAALLAQQASNARVSAENGIEALTENCSHADNEKLYTAWNIGVPEKKSVLAGDVVLSAAAGDADFAVVATKGAVLPLRIPLTLTGADSTTVGMTSGASDVMWLGPVEKSGDNVVMSVGVEGSIEFFNAPSEEAAVAAAACGAEISALPNFTSITTFEVAKSKHVDPSTA